MTPPAATVPDARLAVAAGELAMATEPPLTVQGRKLGRLMTLPAQLLLVFIFAFPALMQIYVSLTWWGPLDGTSWIYAYQSFAWFDNYVELISSSRLWEAIGRTMLILIVVVPAEFVIGFGLAILFVDSFPGKRVFYSILLTPMMVVPDRTTTELSGIKAIVRSVGPVVVLRVWSWSERAKLVAAPSALPPPMPWAGAAATLLCLWSAREKLADTPSAAVSSG